MIRRLLRQASISLGSISLGLLAVLASACGASEPVDDAPVFALDREATSGITAVDPNRTDVLPAALLRSLLQDLLTEHSDLSIEVMRQAVDGALGDDSLAELTRNTDELAVAIGVVYGPEGAAAFDQLWTNHIEFFNDYALARGAGDSAAADLAVLSLGHYENDFSSYIDTATSGEADFHAVLHVLHSHVEQLLTQADAWAQRDYELALRLGVDAHMHMDVIAFALANGIAIQQPQAFTGDVAEAVATSCAAQQLETSAALALAGAAAELRDRGIPVAAAAAERLLGDRIAASSGAIEAIDLASVGSFDTPAARALTRDTARDAVAAAGCELSVIGR